jgi:putative transposase
VKGMCTLFGISRAAFYDWQKRQTLPDPDRERKALILAAYKATKKRAGYRMIGLWLREKRSVVINNKAILRLMRLLGIRSVARRRKGPIQKAAGEAAHTYENILARDFTATCPNRKWVTDITFIQTRQGFAYLSSIKDLFGGFIVSYAFSMTKDTALITQTIKEAMEKEEVTDGLILHSDQGTQYTSHAYYVLIQEYSIIPSMSRRANPWDNAAMESFFSFLKDEAFRDIKIPTFMEAGKIIDEYIHYYNYERIQLKTRKTPYQARCLSSSIK